VAERKQKRQRAIEERRSEEGVKVEKPAERKF
jgi:hypothetical protein